MRHFSPHRGLFYLSLLVAILQASSASASDKPRDSIISVAQGKLLIPDDGQPSEIEYFLVATNDSHVHCFDVQAHELWTFPAKPPMELLRADSTTIILRDHARAAAVDPASGVARWTISLDDSDKLQLLEDFIVVTSHQELRVFSATDGKLLWQIGKQDGRIPRALAANSQRLVVLFPSAGPDALQAQLSVVDAHTGHILNADHIAASPQWAGITQSGDVLAVENSTLFAVHRESKTPFQIAHNVYTRPGATPTLSNQSIAAIAGGSIRTFTLDGTPLSDVRIQSTEPLQLIREKRYLLFWTDMEASCINSGTGTIAWRPTVPPECSIKAAAFGKSVLALALESHQEAKAIHLAVTFYDLQRAGFLFEMTQLDAPIPKSDAPAFDALTIAGDTPIASVNQHIYIIHPSSER